MSNETCGCGASTAGQDATTHEQSGAGQDATTPEQSGADQDATTRDQPGADQWVEGPGEPLPADLQEAVGRFFGTAPVETLADLATVIRENAGSGSLGVEDLCHAEESTGHRGVVDGETYEFQCFYDAVVLAEFAEDPVDIRTEAPDGTVVEAHADGDGSLSVDPEHAVMSFGVAADVDPPDGDVRSMAAAYAAICPYVKAFPDREAYAEWAGTVPAVTVALPLADATALAEGLAAE